MTDSAAETSPTEEEVQDALDNNERWRARARAQAALIAAAAAGLVAGLLVGNGNYKHFWPLFLHISSVTLLLASASAFVTASMAYSRNETVQGTFRRGVLHLVAFWVTDPGNLPARGKDSLEVAEKISERIRHISNTGLYLAAVGAVTLLGSLWLLLLPTPTSVVLIELDEPANFAESCPALVGATEAIVSETELASNSEFLKLRISSETCETVADINLTVRRESFSYQNLED